MSRRGVVAVRLGMGCSIARAAEDRAWGSLSLQHVGLPRWARVSSNKVCKVCVCLDD